MLLACLLFLYQSPLSAQCTCTGGIPATAIDQSITISPTTTSTLNFNFQQFNPAIGNLSCVSLHDTLVGTSVTGALNTGPLRTAFLFALTLVNKITGPGISISNVYSTTHGIDTLDPFGVVPTDSITYGPENIITNPNCFCSAGCNPAYLGTGTVNFVYDVNGGMITIQGGSNYKSSVTTVIRGCNASPDLLIGVHSVPLGAVQSLIFLYIKTVETFLCNGRVPTIKQE